MKQQNAKVGLSISEPVIVAQAPPGIVGWGPYQFPWIERLADGALHVTFHRQADSATAYGLANGHLASYGRPGHFLRATSDPSGRLWDPRVTLVEPGSDKAHTNTHTCAYSVLIALSCTRALIVYCEFKHSAAQGHPCKTLLSRFIDARVP